MQTIDFYKLERSAQERFVGSLNGKGLPTPIVSVTSKYIAPLFWRGASAGCGLLLIALLVTGFGNVESKLAIEGASCLVGGIALAGFVAFGLLHAAALRRKDVANPYRPGLYVFPVGLIDARKPVFRLYPIADLSGVFGPDVRGMTLDFGGQAFSFPAPDAATVESVKEQLQAARGAVGEVEAATASMRPGALAAVDPLQGYANPLASSESMKKVVDPMGSTTYVIALIVGVVVGGVLWMVRNTRSDEAMYAKAVAAGDAPSLTAYLDKGSRHVAEVSSVLLPRAQLKDVVAGGNIDAIEQFIKEHPKGAVATEARTALKDALVKELDVAVKAGTLAALDDFAKRHEQHAQVTAELAAARHGVYQAALTKYQGVAGTDKAAAAFIARLVAWSEKKGPKVLVRFRSEKSKSMEKADRAAGQSRGWKGVVSLPSHYFDDAAQKPERDALSTAVAARFADVFTPDILAVSVGEAIVQDAPLPAQVAEPTLFVDVSTVWGGYVVASQKPRGVFFGMDVGFDATFRLPDDAHPVKLKQNAWRAPELTIAKDADKPEEVVYTSMRDKAFEQFQKRLLGAFFAK